MKDHILFSIKEIIPETKDAVTLVLENTEGKPVFYRAGQFLTFVFNIHGREIRRSYSLSSAPGIDQYPAVTVKRVPNGEISRYLFSHVSRGSILRSLVPAGRFTLAPASAEPRDIFLFGAGSGIVPLFSILKTVLTNEQHTRVHLIYSNHNEQSVIFRENLQQLQDAYKDRFSCLHVLSSTTVPGENVIQGHLNNSLVEKLVGEYLHFERSKAVFYLCGPFAYMRMIMIALPLLGISGEQIYREIYLPEINAGKTKIPPDNIDSKVGIYMGDKLHEINVPRGKTILKAALENGINLPYSCESGICSTCSVFKSEGKVEMSINEVLTDKEISAGLVLTCTGYPVTPRVTIRLQD